MGRPGRFGRSFLTREIPERVARRAYYRWIPGAGGCFISTYSTASHGYAQIGWQDSGGRDVTLAHRAAWTFANGAIPEGLTIDHLCKNRQCVNVSHMRLLSNYENGRRTSGRDWPLGTCIRGHSNAELVRNYKGKLICRKCRNLWQRTYRAKRAQSGK
ncbi:HNH endonuclease signature motif containing protein [Mycobacteroides abscessus]|uniref:HNH endonuclease signature motif containing protein n=1 Tax=Mycobacteroides abscessus TaxID=36809 RepID=UPI000D3E2FBE|nr:hypothetical protein DDJ40_08365 [Mycobacteroides abscessus]RIU40364.1 HNH endonuclease [Mycobacteroides abscessus]